MGGSYWRVTVAAAVLDMVGGDYEFAGIRYYEVVADVSGTTPVAVAAPVRLSDPVGAGEP